MMKISRCWMQISILFYLAIKITTGPNQIGMLVSFNKIPCNFLFNWASNIVMLSIWLKWCLLQWQLTLRWNHNDPAPTWWTHWKGEFFGSYAIPYVNYTTVFHAKWKDRQILRSMHLQLIKQYPCLYSGFIIDPDNPSDSPLLGPLPIGLYLDDFIYFSTYDVKDKFQKISQGWKLWISWVLWSGFSWLFHFACYSR